MKAALAEKMRLATKDLPSFLHAPQLHLYVLFSYLCFAILTLSHLDRLRDAKLDRLIGRDFINFWSAGRLLLEGDLASLYDLSAFHKAEQLLIGQNFGWHFWSYPPLSLPFILPFGFLPYLPSYVIWCALGLGLYAASLRFLFPRFLPLLGMLALSPASVENITAGQNGFFTTALLITGLRFMTTRPLIAGLCFGMMAIKPQLAIFVPFVLLAARAWKTIAFTTLTALVLGSFSIALYGTTPWVDYIQSTMAHEKWLVENDKLFLFAYLIPSPFYALRIIGVATDLAKDIQIIISLLCAGGVYYLFRITKDVRLQIAVYGSAIFLATPYALNYDMPILAAASIALAMTKPFTLLKERIILLAAWLLPLYLELVNHLHIAIGPLVIAGILALATQQILAAKAPKPQPNIS
ncbi:MAG: glycosyltransferase family 87 protein [Alphaproteobacteria bacterium]|nr:glycosyltransferase family 87 protein [Alphaproteobacteria bacterium]